MIMNFNKTMGNKNMTLNCIYIKVQLAIMIVLCIILVATCLTNSG
jgi:hypothetical protein